MGEKVIDYDETEEAVQPAVEAVETGPGPTAEELVKSIASLISAFALYPSRHPKIGRAVERIGEELDILFRDAARVTIGLLGRELLVLGNGLHRIHGAHGVPRIFQDVGLEKIVFIPGVTSEELCDFFASSADEKKSAASGEKRWPHIETGRFSAETIVEDLQDSQACFSSEEVQVVHEYLEASHELISQIRENRMIEFNLAREIVENILSGIIFEESAIPLVAQIKEHDEYTFSHILNVSTLSLAVGRVLGLSPEQLRMFGIAALLHDTGKSLIPLEILQKKGRLTDEEFEIVKRHPVDGARILMGNRTLPALAPIVAFEHHLHFDGMGGYPISYRGTPPHFCSRITAIADVFDALRSIRVYRGEVSKAETFRKMSKMPFDPFLFNLFARVARLYPVGEFVRLDTGETGVIHELHPQNAFRPRVRLLYNAEQKKQSAERVVNLNNFDRKQNRYVRSIETILPREEVDKLA